ncbi:hypothetical protein [Frateuria sp. Soil773]|uniref:hypothetical protein n=1 Tax=Frateuria sp. Soil773 TaxID=1736407 RepID=UPI0012F80469|nr:hypothetical protein [Frateuria sp. Soil773]
MPKSKRDLADLLQSVMIIEAVSDRRPSASSDNIEVALGLVKQVRDTNKRRFSSGRVTQSRRGDHALRPETLKEVLSLEPEAWPVCSDIIWPLLRSGRFELLHPDLYYKGLSKPVHTVLHFKTSTFSFGPLGAVFNPVTLGHVSCLAVLGTLDAVTALWKLLIEAIENGDHTVLMIARHIPPALAMFYRRPEGRRTAIVLFARMRQLILDRVQVDGIELSLSNYDLAAVADGTSSWGLPSLGAPHHPAFPKEAETRSLVSPVEGKEAAKPVRHGLPSHRGPPELPKEALKWLERACAPIRKVRRRRITGAKWTGRAPWPIDVINQPHPSHAAWGDYAIAQFKKELGDYFFAGAP